MLISTYANYFGALAGAAGAPPVESEGFFIVSLGMVSLDIVPLAAPSLAMEPDSAQAASASTAAMMAAMNKTASRRGNHGVELPKLGRGAARAAKLSAELGMRVGRGRLVVVIFV
jgi:hypothetical protein